MRETYAAMALLEGGTERHHAGRGGSQLFLWARRIVRGAQEREKPSTERLPEFADSRLAGVQSACSPNGRSIRRWNRSAWNGGCPRRANG